MGVGHGIDSIRSFSQFSTLFFLPSVTSFLLGSHGSIILFVVWIHDLITSKYTYKKTGSHAHMHKCL